MEVRARSGNKAVLLAQGKALGAVLRAVAGVVHLYAVHCALCRQLAQQGHTFVHRGVGKHHRAAAGFSGSQHLPHRQILRRVQHDAPGVPPEQLVVGLAVDAAIGQTQQFQRLHQPAFEQHPAGLGGLPRKVGGKLRVQLLQLLCALQSAGVAALLHDGAVLPQRRAVHVRVVAQQVHPVLPLKVVAGQLHGRDQLYPVLPGVGVGVLGAEQGVVIGKGDGVQPGAGGDGRQPLDGHSTV